MRHGQTLRWKLRRSTALEEAEPLEDLAGYCDTVQVEGDSADSLCQEVESGLPQFRP